MVTQEQIIEIEKMLLSDDNEHLDLANNILVQCSSSELKGICDRLNKKQYEWDFRVKGKKIIRTNSEGQMRINF